MSQPQGAGRRPQRAGRRPMERNNEPEATSTATRAPGPRYDTRTLLLHKDLAVIQGPRCDPRTSVRHKDLVVTSGPRCNTRTSATESDRQSRIGSHSQQQNSRQRKNGSTTIRGLADPLTDRATEAAPPGQKRRRCNGLGRPRMDTPRLSAGPRNRNPVGDSIEPGTAASSPAGWPTSTRAVEPPRG